MDAIEFTRDAENKLNETEELLNSEELEIEIDEITGDERTVESDERIISKMAEIAKIYSLSKYIKRSLYESSETLRERSFEEVIDDDEAFRKVISEHFNHPDNSEYRDGRKNFSQDVGIWLKDEKCLGVGRDRVIDFALAARMPPEKLDHILQVKLGEAGIHYRDPREAALYYALKHKLGHNGFNCLMEKMQKKLDAILQNPASVLLRLKKDLYTQDAGEKLDTDLIQDEFTTKLLELPLVCFAEALSDALSKKAEDVSPAWRSALERVDPEFFENLPKTQGAARARYLRGKFPGYHTRRKSAGERYSEIQANIIRLYKGFGQLRDDAALRGCYFETGENSDADTEWCVKELNTIFKFLKKNADSLFRGASTTTPNVRKYSHDVLDGHVHEKQPYESKEEYTSRIKDYQKSLAEYSVSLRSVRKDFRSLKDFPAWCKNELKTTLNENHGDAVSRERTSVLANDIILLKLKEIDLKIRLVNALLGKPLTIDELRSIRDDRFKEDVNIVLSRCGMGNINPINPLHFLVLISFIEIEPFAFFTDIVLTIAEVDDYA